MGKGSSLAAVLAAVVAGCLAPVAAHAGTAFVAGEPGNRLIGYFSAPGETSTVYLGQEATPAPVVRFAELGDVPVVAGAGCTVPDPAQRVVECPYAPGDQIGVALGDGDDTLLGAVLQQLTVDAGPGDDTIDASFLAGPSKLLGGPGRDTVTYASRVAGVTVTLDDVAGDGAPGEGDDVGTDVEVVVGTAAADRLVGGPSADRLEGGNGADRLEGGGGGDHLVAGPGCDDVLLGGDGDDVLVPYDIPCGIGQDVSGGAGRDRIDLSGYDSPRYASLDDLADDGPDTEEARDNYRSDVEELVGGSAGDILVGSDGDDLLDGGGGDDLLDGGGGSDDLRGGAGDDIADYSLRSAPVAVTLDGSWNDGEAGEEDNVRDDVEILVGGDGHDTLVGNTAGNAIDGGPGDDTIVGGDGEDLLLGGAGGDRITSRDGGVVDVVDCGDGSDTLDADRSDETTSCESITYEVGGGTPTTPPINPPGRTPTIPQLPRLPQTAAPDTKAPRAAIFAPTGNAMVKTLRRTALTVRVGCDEVCTATVTLRSTPATTRSLRRRKLRGTTVVAKGSATARRRSIHTIRLKPSRLGARKLRALRRARYQLTVVVEDEAGNRTVVRRTVTVAR